MVPSPARRAFWRPSTAWLLVAFLFFTMHIRAQTLAFPGAQGFGEYATGGRNGTVYPVTTLADSGTGSFRDAVSHPNRIIVFDVGGTITLSSAVSCANNLTIAGQTAPGGGIAIIGHEVSFSVLTNEIVRFVRFRPGSLASSTEDAINLGDGTNMIFDHVSVEFAPYNNIDAHGNDTDGNQISFQNSILADPIGQQFNAHTEALNNTFFWWGNIFSSGHDRNPLAKVNTVFVNNVIYNFQAGYTVADTSGNFSHDIVNNYFITGPSTTSPSDDFFQMDSNQKMYATGNLLDSDNNGALDGSATAPGGVTPLSYPWSVVTSNLPIASTTVAYRNDVSLSGALPHDQVDQLVVADVMSLGATGQMWTSQTATGLDNNGYGVINGGVAPVDSDGDGMPDYWEKAVGLDPNNASDAMTIGADGYANIEHYLNWLAGPHALTDTNVPVDVDLWQYTAGFTNASPLYSVRNASNGVVTLSGHLAHFVPATDFSGLGSFQFVVVANDGSSVTNAVSVLMTPITIPENLTWQGDGLANVWTNGGPANWNDGTNLVAFSSGDNVTFDDTGSNTPAITLAGPISAGIVSVIADNQDYVFAGTGFLSGGTALFKTGNGQLTLDTSNNFSGGTTINDGVVQVGDGVADNGALTGGVTNNSTLIFATPGTLSSAASISGSGMVIETGPGTLILSGSQTYTGPTTLNGGALTFSGTPPPSDIADNGSLTLAPSSLQVYTNGISGPGSLTTSPTGVLILDGTNTFAGNLTNTSGFLILSNNAAAGLGTVVDSGGLVVAAAGMVITNNFSIPTSTSDLNLMATNSGTAVWAGNVVNLGSSASWRPGSDGGTLMFTGSATQGAHNFIIPRGAVQIASNAVVSATGTATALGRDGSANNRSANITFRDNSATTLGVCSLGGGKSGGSVTVTVQNNAQLSFGGNNLDLHDVTRSTAVTTLRLNGGTTTVGGFTKTQGSYTNFIDFNGGILKAGANNAAFLPAMTLQTNLVQAGGALIDDGGFTAVAIASPLIHDPALGATPDGGLTKLNTGTLTLAAVETYTGPTYIAAGVLSLYAPPLSSIGNSASIYIAAGAQFNFATGGTGALTLGAGKTLWGNGSVAGNFTLGTGALLAPGSNTIGTLTFNNSLTLAAGSTNLFELSHSPLTNDNVIITGSLTNGGALVVSNVGGTPLAAGDTFQLFNAASYSGAFASVQLPALAAGLIWNTNQLNTAGVISVAVNAPPVIGAIAVSGTSLDLSGTGGAANGSYVLLGTTNLSTPTSNWVRLLTNQFDSSGNFNVATNLTPGQTLNFYRLLLQ